MAERLTIKNSDNTYSQPTDTTFEMVFNKLGELEDILEKYGIGDLIDLEIKLESTNESIKKAQQKLVEIYIQDRDTWKRACEMACDAMTKLGGDDCCGCRLNKEMCNICDNKKALIDYFYQQAKKEGEKNNV